MRNVKKNKVVTLRFRADERMALAVFEAANKKGLIGGGSEFMRMAVEKELKRQGIEI